MTFGQGRQHEEETNSGAWVSSALLASFLSGGLYYSQL